MNLGSLIAIVGKSAPLLASALGSPIAGMAIGLIENLFGMKSSTPDELANAINADPDAAIKLKELELKHTEDLQKITADTYSTEVRDRESARQRESDVTKATGNRDWIVHTLAITFTVGFFIYISVTIFSLVQFNSDIFHDLLSAELLILSYYFGSCHQMSRSK
jgi:hypothetical protein